MIILIVMFHMSSIVYVVVKKTLSKTTCRGEVLFHLIGYIIHQKGKSRQEVKAGA